MLKKLLSLMLASALACAPLSCATEATVEPRQDESERDAEEDRMEALAGLEQELRASDEVRELLGILEDGARRLSQRGISAADLMRLQEADPREAAAAMGFSWEEAEALLGRIGALREAILARFPALETLAEETTDAAGSGLRLQLDDEVAIPVDPPEKGTVTCSWNPLILSLVACATVVVVTGNLAAFFICAYQALCSFCDGGWVSEACL